MVKRAVTGVIFLAVMISSILFKPETLLALFAVITAVAMYEFYSVQLLKRIRANTFYGIFIGLMTVFITYGVTFYNLSPLWYVGLMPLFLLVPIFELYKQSTRPVANIAKTLWGIVYIAVPASLVFPITSSVLDNSGYEPWLLLALFIFIWLSDTGAYLSGRFFGKRKLFERISPKKTIEGAVGGTLISIGGSIVLSFWVDNLSMIEWAGAALIVSVTGIYGDLVESQFKRYFEIKDSGNTLPGHGGFLDRFDSFIFAAPFYFTYLLIINFIHTI